MTKPNFRDESIPAPGTKVIREINPGGHSDRYLHLVPNAGASHLFIQDNNLAHHVTMRNSIYGKWTEGYSLNLDDVALIALLDVLDDIRVKRGLAVPPAHLALTPLQTEGGFQLQHRMGGQGVYVAKFFTDSYEEAVARGDKDFERTRHDMRIVSELGKILKKWSS